MMIKNTGKRSGIYIMNEYGAFIAFLILMAVNACVTKNFISISTLMNLLSQSTTVAILSLGMTIVIATGGIDISVGSMMALCGMITSTIILAGSIPLGIAASLSISAAIGFTIGILIVKLRLQPMITTLSTMFILRGAAKVISSGHTVSYRNAAYVNFFFYNIFGMIPIRIILWVILAVTVGILLSKTAFGVYIASYGDNPKAATISGMNVVAVVAGCYVLSGVLSCLAGIIEIGYVASANPSNMGLTKEMDAIAATVVGGTPISGGKPRIFGTICGALVLQLITLMVNMNNIPSSYARVIKAILIILAVYVQHLSRQFSKS
jgi:ribose transport system permease protein